MPASKAAACEEVKAYSFPYVEPLRFTPRRIRLDTFVNAAELVRRRCPARTMLGKGASWRAGAGG